jgi:hypothetical protein
MNDSVFIESLFFCSKSKNKDSVISNLTISVDLTEMVKNLKFKKMQDLSKEKFTNIICSYYFLYQNFVVL